jgi:hypothetical protein
MEENSNCHCIDPSQLIDSFSKSQSEEKPLEYIQLHVDWTYQDQDYASLVGPLDCSLPLFRAATKCFWPGGNRSSSAGAEHDFLTFWGKTLHDIN